MQENKFTEYGFETPDFECKLYDKLDDYILGAYFNPNKQRWTMCRWGFDGRNKQGSYNYALKPLVIIKPWYETCTFPILTINEFNNIENIRERRQCPQAYLEGLRPLTDAELEALKQGF